MRTRTSGLARPRNLATWEMVHVRSGSAWIVRRNRPHERREPWDCKFTGVNSEAMVFRPRIGLRGLLRRRAGYLRKVPGVDRPAWLGNDGRQRNPNVMGLTAFRISRK